MDARSATAMLGAAPLLVLLVGATTDAAAAYSGFITRAMCGSEFALDSGVGSLSWYIETVDGGCAALWGDAVSPGEAVYHQLVERSGASTTITTTVHAYGSASPALGRVCATSRTFFSTGAVNQVSATSCTAGATAVLQDVITANLVLTAGGAANTYVTATSEATLTSPAVVRRIAWTYTSNSESMP